LRALVSPVLFESDCMSRILIVILASLSVMSGCIQTAPPTNSSPQNLAQDLAKLGVPKTYIPFLTQEAVQAGVSQFRPMPLNRNAGKSSVEARLYGLTKRNRIIYLDTETNAGRSPFIILHEIAHAAHYGGACGGHHSTWAAEFTRSAERFQLKYPQERWLGLRPAKMAHTLARQYGVGTKCP
jgi:hypothetical protein